LALLVRIAIWHRRAKFLLLDLSQLRNPVGKGIEAFLDQSRFQTVAPQLRTHPQRPLTPLGVVGDEILGVAPVVEQFLGAQRVEQRRNH